MKRAVNRGLGAVLADAPMAIPARFVRVIANRMEE